MMSKRLEQKLQDRSRAFRSFDIEYRKVDDKEKKEMIVEGYALRFNSPTVIFEMDGIEYKEVIDPSALDGAIMDDVIFNYDHMGKVMARTRNNTLKLNRDSQGLYIEARLEGTSAGRELYEEIDGGYVDKMSFQFRIEEESYNKDTRTWTIKKIKKLYDVSAVSIPAYDTTSISARNRQEDMQKRLDSQDKKRLLLEMMLDEA
jgi:HK97 family phage prohead protease